MKRMAIIILVLALVCCGVSTAAAENVQWGISKQHILQMRADGQEAQFDEHMTAIIYEDSVFGEFSATEIYGFADDKLEFKVYGNLTAHDGQAVKIEQLRDALNESYGEGKQVTEQRLLKFLVSLQSQDSEYADMDVWEWETDDDCSYLWEFAQDGEITMIWYFDSSWLEE